MSIRLRFAARDKHLSKGLPSVRPNFATAFSRGEANRQAIGIKVSLVLLVHLSKCYLAEKHQPSCILSRGLAVIGRFADHIGKVDSFAEHIACRRRLRWGDS